MVRSVDGVVGRTKKRSDTYNATSNIFNYPSTPMRIQLSIWPGGDPTYSAPGTVAWAGGQIDWDSPDIQQFGYDFATIKEVTIQCYSPPAGANVQGDVSYIYTNNLGLNNSVEVVNNGTVLKSLLGTGTNVTAVSASSATSTSTSTSASSATSGSSSTSSTSVPDSVPNGAGGGSADSDRGSSNDSSSSGSSDSSSTSSSSSSSTPAVTGFSQNTGSSSSPSASASSKSGATALAVNGFLAMAVLSAVMLL